MLGLQDPFNSHVQSVHILPCRNDFGQTNYSYANYVIGIGAHALSYINSAINPVIYSFMSKNFRECFRAAFCCKKVTKSACRILKKGWGTLKPIFHQKLSYHWVLNRNEIDTNNMKSTWPSRTGADPGGGSWGSGPPPFGGHLNFIKRGKTSRVCARKGRDLVLDSYPDPPPLSQILYPPLAYLTQTIFHWLALGGRIG